MNPEPTPSQLKIDGIISLPEIWSHGDFETWFQHRLNTSGFAFDGHIGPINPDAESFMVEVPKDDWKLLKDTCNTYREMVDQLNNKIQSNNLAYSDLAEQLRQEKADRNQLLKAYDLLEVMYESRGITISNQNNVIKAMETRLRVKDSPIKAGLKRIWKWFKGLVGK